MNKVFKSQEELKKELDSQFKLLKVLTEQYDKGDVIIGKSIATSIRVLVHDTDDSRSLLGQLNFKNRKFFDTACPDIFPVPGKIQRIGSFCGLVSIGSVNNEQTYIPYLDEAPVKKFGFVNFDEFWNRIIFIDNNKNSFTRKEIVLAIANQDGGAHVDPKIEKKYKELSRENSLGWKASLDGKIWNDSCGSELAAVRQIAHELLRTFEIEYPYKKMVTGDAGFILGGMGFIISNTTDVNSITDYLVNKKKIGPNKKCLCGSGQKYKKCHGKYGWI